MATVAAGNIPYYGIYNNNAQKINCNIASSSSNYETEFNYIPNFNVTINSRIYHAEFYDNSLRLHCQADNLSYNYLYHLSSTVNDFNIANCIGQKTITIDGIFPQTPRFGSVKNCDVYVYEASTYLFFHIAWKNDATELILTNDGWLQVWNGGNNPGYSMTADSTENFFTGNQHYYSCNNSCLNCRYYQWGDCNRGTSSRTSCYYGTSYNELDKAYTSFSVPSNRNYIIKPANTTTGDKTLVLETGTYLSALSGLIKSVGEIYVAGTNNAGRHEVPLKATRTANTNYLNVRVQGQSAQKFILMTKEVNINIPDSPFKLSYNGATYRERNVRTAVANRQHIQYTSVLDTDFGYLYTSGSPGSSSWNWWSATIYRFNTRINVASIRLILKAYQGGKSGTYAPNSSYSSYWLCYHGNSSNITHTGNIQGAGTALYWTSGEYSTVNFSFPSPYQNVHFKTTLNINGYIKEFAIRPATTDSITGSLGTGIAAIEVIDANTGQTYTFTN